MISRQIRILLILLTLVMSGFASSATPSHNDPSHEFSINIPSNWTTKVSLDESSFVRYTTSSPSKEITLYVCASQIAKGRADPAKIADQANQMFQNLGPETERKRVRGSYEVFFGKNRDKEYAKGLFASKEHFYYIIIAYSKTNDYAEAKSIFESFRISAPFSVITIVFIVGSLSLALHLYLLHQLFFESYLSEVITCIVKFDVKTWEFAKLFGFMAGLGAVDYFVVQKIISAALLDGVNGAVEELINIGPYLFDAAGDFISEMMAEVIGIGFWPGGTVGVFFTTAVSLIVNYFEAIYLFNHFKEKIIAIRDT